MTPDRPPADFRPRPRKSLGQHFLADQGVVHRILARARLVPSLPVLEVGPGHGELTLPLAKSMERVLAVEKDGRLAERLREKLRERGIANVTVIDGDILRWPFETALARPSERLQVIGNLPYNISAPFLEKLLENRCRLDRAVLMFQLEVARRLTAPPGNKSYGALSVIVQGQARVKPLFEVPGTAFRPRPKVDSMVVEMDFGPPARAAGIPDVRFRQVVRASFAHRRKTLLNSLRGALPSLEREGLRAAIETCGIDPGCRAETLELEDFLCLAGQLELTGDKKCDS